MRQFNLLSLITVAASLLLFESAQAEMGPCVPAGKDAYAGEDVLTCGANDGAARVIAKTTSPSKRLALAWRLVNHPPIYRPDDRDPNLENLIVRVSDGAVLGKFSGNYWDIGDRTAKANMFASWSSDSHLLIAGSESAESDTAELFMLSADDRVTGWLDLVKVIEPAVREQANRIKDGKNYSFRITYLPGIAIDNEGLIHASVYLAEKETREGPIYELTAKVNRTVDSIDVKVLSISEYLGPRISVTIH